MELITVEEFAEKLKIGRTTVFQWLKDGTLVQGKHFIKIGRVIRFQWPDVVDLIVMDNIKNPESEKKLRNEPVQPRQKAAIDLQYNWPHCPPRLRLVKRTKPDREEVTGKGI